MGVAFPFAHAVCDCSALVLEGTSPRVNVFHVSASDFLFATDIVLRLPGYVPGNAGNMTVIINVLYEAGYTGPSSMVTNSSLAVEVNMVAFGMSGLFDDIDLLPHIIWNFPHAKVINMSYVSFRGSILAPYAGKPIEVQHCNRIQCF